MTLAVDVYQLKLANFVFKFLFESWNFPMKQIANIFQLLFSVESDQKKHM